MAIEYIINQECPVKEKLTIDKLISLIKQRDNALRLVKILRNEGKTMEEIKNSTFQKQKNHLK